MPTPIQQADPARSLSAPLEVRLEEGNDSLGERRPPAVLAEKPHEVRVQAGSNLLTPDDLQVLVRQRLLPFPGKAFGGSTGLIDVGVGEDLHHKALRPRYDPRFLLLNGADGAEGTTALVDHDKDNAISEVVDLLKLERQVLERAEPILKKGTTRRRPLEARTERRGFEDAIVRTKVDDRFNVTPTKGVNHLPRERNQIGGRGLLRHRLLRQLLRGRHARREKP